MCSASVLLGPPRGILEQFLLSSSDHFLAIAVQEQAVERCLVQTRRKRRSSFATCQEEKATMSPGRPFKIHCPHLNLKALKLPFFTGSHFSIEVERCTKTTSKTASASCARRFRISNRAKASSRSEFQLRIPRSTNKVHRARFVAIQGSKRFKPLQNNTKGQISSPFVDESRYLAYKSRSNQNL